MGVPDVVAAPAEPVRLGTELVEVERLRRGLPCEAGYSMM